METYVVRLRIKGGVIVQDADFRCVRPTYRGGWALPMSPYANPFFAKHNKTGNPITDSMMAVRDFYQYWFDPKQAELRELAHTQLPGKTLGCFCRDKAEDPNANTIPCHCDVLTYDVNDILTPILSQIIKTYNLVPKNGTMIPANHPQTPLIGQIPTRHVPMIAPVATPTFTLPVMPVNPATLTTGNTTPQIPVIAPRVGTPTVHVPVMPVNLGLQLDIEDDTGDIPQNNTPVTNDGKPDPDRIMAMIAGHAMGDALGTPHEFRYQHDVYTGVLQFRAKIVQQFQPVRHLGVGQYSDDTEMALTIARTMIKDHADKWNKHGVYNKDHVLDAYLMWGHSKQPMMGSNTRQLLKGGVKAPDGSKLNSKAGAKGYNERFAQKFGMQATAVPLMTITEAGEAAQSNGAIMRAWPLACIEDMGAVVTDTWLTNPSTVAVDTNQVYVTALRLAILGTPAAEIWEMVQEMGQTEAVLNCIRSVAADEVWSLADTPAQGDTPKIKSRAWCVNGLYAALVCLKAIATTGFDSSTYPSLINWVIAGHPGSDTDTIAAIAGALIGALVGYETLIADETTRDNLGKVLVPNWEDSDVPRPSEYMLNDIAEIAIAMTNLTGPKPEKYHVARLQRLPSTKYQSKEDRLGIVAPPVTTPYPTINLKPMEKKGRGRNTTVVGPTFQAGYVVEAPKPPAIPTIPTVTPIAVGIIPVFNSGAYPKPPPVYKPTTVIATPPVVPVFAPVTVTRPPIVIATVPTFTPVTVARPPIVIATVPTFTPVTVARPPIVVPHQ
jgi:ADP-ribosylglycohydrolase